MISSRFQDATVPSMDGIDVPSGTPVPCREELAAVARAGGHEIVYLDSGSGGGREALPFLFRRRRIAGITLNVLELAGRDFFDYAAHLNFLEARELLARIGDFARGMKADCVALEQLLSTIEADSPLSGRRFQTGFISGMDGRPLNEVVLGHTSVRRHIRSAERKIGLTAETIDDPARIAAILPELAALHKERWNFDGVESAFDVPARIHQYEAASGRALVVRIVSGNEVLAVHYGLVFETTMLWHTPVINVAFLEYSPLEILLGKVAEACAEKRIEHLDLGLGDETYKARFSVATRDVFGYVLPITARGHAVAYLYHANRSERVRDLLLGLATRASTAKIAWRQRLTSVRHFHSPDASSPDVPPMKGGEYLEVGTWRELIALLRRGAGEIRRFQYDRIRSGSRFVCLFEDETVRCSGWISKPGAPFHVRETGEEMPGGSPVLYDFMTPEAYRKRGYYTRLLTEIRSAREELRIFATSGNVASVAGILTAGFREYQP